MKEVWKDIQNYEGLYKISNYGNIVSLKHAWGNRDVARIVSQHITKKGYKRVGLHKDNKSKLYMVHRLVAETFISNPTKEQEINHKNYDRTDNYVNNLEWLSHTQNVRYSKAKKVNQYDLNNNLIKMWDCARDAEREIGVDHGQISKCCNGKQKTHRGYIWKYIEE